MLFSTMIDVENSPSGLWRTLGKRVGVTASRVRISYSPRVGVLASIVGWNPFYIFAYALKYRVIGQKVCKAKLMNILEIEVISLAF